DRGEREPRRRHLKGEALADEPVYLRLMVEHIARRSHPAGAVPEQEELEPGMARFRDRYRACDVCDVIRDILDIEALAFRTPPAAQVERENRIAAPDQLIRRPEMLPAMRIDAVADDHHRTRLARRLPCAVKDLD